MTQKRSPSEFSYFNLYIVGLSYAYILNFDDS